MIGTISIPRADNYGSVLQCYAVQKILDSYNVSNEYIDYISPFLIGRYKVWYIDNSSIKRLLRTTASSILNLYNKVSVKQKFEEFRKFIRFSDKSYIDGKQIDTSKYDRIIFGGDQIWNIRITKMDRTFFGFYLDSRIKKYSFSVSMGFDDRTDLETKFYTECLQGFKRITIREDRDINFVKEQSNCPYVNSILDPTLLLTYEEWKAICSQSKKIIREKYILIYAFQNDNRVVKTARLLSQKYCLPIYIINNSIKTYDANGFRNIRRIGPKEFLSLIRNAECIVTNSFHGTALSIEFQKEFFSIPYEGTGERMISLCKLLGLDNRIVYDDKYQLPEDRIDYVAVNHILDAKRHEAADIIDKMVKD